LQEDEQTMRELCSFMKHWDCWHNYTLTVRRSHHRTNIYNKTSYIIVGINNIHGNGISVTF